MKITWGKTRIVFLFGDKAIKIAKIRFFRLFFRLLTMPFLSKSNHERFYRKHGRQFLRAMWSYLIFGLSANRNEYAYYQGSYDIDVMPTERMMLGGWIVIQPRGTPVSKAELDESNPFMGYPVNPDFLEKDQPWQFCRDEDGRIVLVDYGRKETVDALRQINSQPLKV